ncbi:hypothetical protein DUNSADRAFT_5953 [Dunaliella salina]|uniref:Coatomer subunit delta n=1 Tax=Dunaliella salina TaxID=3046 RepID=A0ABQ7GPB8_DUNSA|nr:hypothetical protein DUNSADRAFT_5953 [Dunaliella salina]|eukprot:KAF5836447.1 hypothetical protein DUNSADRAFT_5953 [Dunaliella salina]
MVVLAASVLAKSGKPIVSRQYVDMSRIRIEGLLAAFPKLVGTGKQHTYVETENVRYVYQPMEGLYVLLVTNKQSNILEDLETLRLVSKLVPEFCQGLLEEEAVSMSAFDLIFAFDEVISLGHKENTTVLQVKQNCEMESHEEKLHKMIIQSKINDTKDIMKKKAIEIDKVKFENRKVTSAHVPVFAPVERPLPIDTISKPSLGVRPEPVVSKPSTPSSRGPSKGMQLGKAKKANEFLESLAKEGEAVEVEAPRPAAGPAGGAALGGGLAPAARAATEPCTIDIDEKLSVHLNKEGGLENLEVQGTMSLVVNNDEDAFVRVAINSGPNRGFQFKTHPNIDKAAYSSSNMLGLKDPSRPFPTGSELGILKWRYRARTQHRVDGDWKFDSRRGVLVWTIELIDETNRSGSMEFVVPAADSDSFYPVEVSFGTNKTMCDINVDSVIHTMKDTPIKFSSKRQLVTSDYTVT